MAQKNRPTLFQQFSDFINRVAPFNANPLIQKTEHLTVETDLFDSILFKQENSLTINSPAANFSLDFASIDRYSVNTTGSIGSTFLINISNLSPGQVARIKITKKTNDVFSIGGATISPISNISQVGTSMAIYVMNVNGTLIPIIDKTLTKSDTLTSNSQDQLVTSRGINQLRIQTNNDISSLNSVVALKADKDQGAWTSLSLVNGWTGSLFVRKMQWGEIQFKGYISANNATAATITTLPTSYRPSLIILTSFLPTFPLFGVVGNVPIIIYNNGDISRASFSTGSQVTAYFNQVRYY